jgi:2-polyprenyl-3-methyl-5-hydroxy-6-metoxy-1,4-benzoquinol methylase
MSYCIDIVVLSNIEKDLYPDVEVIVGLPTNDPWSLPFGHKQIFADRVYDYDLFVYSEDDVLVTQTNIESFRRVTEVLPPDMLAGFFRFEHDVDGNRWYPDVHRNFHWDPESLCTVDGRVFAHFTNQHAAVYILTQSQLIRALASGGFLVGPHSEQYDLLVSAATDPYTQCGFKKVICISQFEEFLVHHLPNKYINYRLSMDDRTVSRQLARLCAWAERRDVPAASLLKHHPAFRATEHGANYYENVKSEVVDAIPESARTVLSIGCGWGATEERIAEQGRDVVAVPLESLIAVSARDRGIEVVDGDLDTVMTRLADRKFDCIVIRDILHLVERPGEMLSMAKTLLHTNANVVISVPNLSRLPILWRRLRGYGPYRGLGSFQTSGVHISSKRMLNRWLREAGLQAVNRVETVPERWSRLHPTMLRVILPYVSREIIVVASRAERHEPLHSATAPSGNASRSAAHSGC